MYQVSGANHGWLCLALLSLMVLSACSPNERSVVPVLVDDDDKPDRPPYQTIIFDGSCNGFSFPMAGDGQNISTSWPLRVLRDDAPVYSDANGSRINTRLKFADVLDPVRISDRPDSGRVLVSESGSLPGESLGWMDRQELLCQIEALKNDKQLDRKAFIKTPPEPEIQGRVKTSSVPAYRCYQGRCRKNISLSGFQMYFIVAENSHQYLLSEQYNLVLGPPLIGWVNKDNIIPWNSSVQVRPAESVGYVLAYSDLSSAREKRQPIKITGGNIWYKFPLHLPLLDIQQV